MREVLATTTTWNRSIIERRALPHSLLRATGWRGRSAAVVDHPARSARTRQPRVRFEPNRPTDRPDPPERADVRALARATQRLLEHRPVEDRARLLVVGALRPLEFRLFDPSLDEPVEPSA